MQDFLLALPSTCSPCLEHPWSVGCHLALPPKLAGGALPLAEELQHEPTAWVGAKRIILPVRSLVAIKQPRCYVAIHVV